MALAASPPPSAALTDSQQALSDQLDAEIAKARAEIEHISQRNNLLASALLSKTAVQGRLRQHATLSSDADLASRLDAYVSRQATNSHRLALGVTAFPFSDPSPDTSERPLLGIRFDVCSREGLFDSPSYYVMCKTVSDESNDIRVHHHTIPALVPIQQYEERYLPLQDEGYGSETSMLEGGAQDLKGFVKAVRADLLSWRSRKESIALVKERLGLNAKDVIEGAPTRDKFGVASIDATGIDALYVRVVWERGSLGRIRLDTDGSIKAAVVLGNIDGEDQRIKKVERMLSPDGARLEDLYDLLKKIHDSQQG